METTRLDRRGILAYVLIATGLAWVLEFAAIASGVRFDALTGTGMLVLTAAMFTPAIAAFIVRRFVTREGFASAGLRFGPWRVYVAIVLGVFALFAVIYPLSALLGAARFDPGLTETLATLQAMIAKSGVSKPLPSPGALLGITLFASLTFAPVMTAIATFGEEFGWTGYLLPKLLPLGKWQAVAIYGFLWGFWHAPIIATGYNYPGHPVLGPILMCVAAIVMGLFQAALRLRYNSVLITTWFHACINTQARGIFPMLVVGVNPLLGGLAGLVGLVVMGAIGAYLLARSPEPDVALAAIDSSTAR